MAFLSKFIAVKRRYSRSVNLERDIEIADSLVGYIPTPRAVDGIERFLRAFNMSNSVRAWTITGPYGTGKSAFAHFLTAICAPLNSQIRAKAIQVVNSDPEYKRLGEHIVNDLPKKGLIRAVVTAQREPITNTVIRALERSSAIYWRKSRGRRPDVLNEIIDLYSKSQNGEILANDNIIRIIKALAEASKTGILLIIDELGKNLEFSAYNQSVDDLYLLQQIAELPSGKSNPKIFLFGLLHQSFGDYGHGLTISQRNEWAKIQGRFEDVHYIESSDQMVRLIGQAIEHKSSIKKIVNLDNWSRNWKSKLNNSGIAKNISPDNFASIYPIHPISSIILPILCSKFSQNDRTLFTFLASREPNSLSEFLSETTVDNQPIPTFKLDKIYDYFVESAGMSISLRPQSQKWIEIQGRLLDAKDLSAEARAILKTIGLLNIISTTGALKASKEIIALSMCDDPDDTAGLSYWQKVIDAMIDNGFLTWRKQIDELRIWEGSDFDIEKEIADKSQLKNISLANLLNEHFPLSPVIAQRHSYQTGTLRYFERRYFHNPESLESIKCKNADSDGLIIYWLGDKKIIKSISNIPDWTADKKPLVIILSDKIGSLRTACLEYVALKKIEKEAIKLQTDGVARREVNQRLFISEKLLEKSRNNTFDFVSGTVLCWGLGDIMKFRSWESFQGYLSIICDTIYEQGLCLWNELINRRELTSQGSGARRKLVVAMLENEGQERLGLVGHGPECSMYDSMLKQTGLHRNDEEGWFFTIPEEGCGIYDVWRAIESFCQSASESPKNISELYEMLQMPPFGAKQGPIPILLLVVLLYHKDYLSLYLDGTFIPVLGAEHFELLVKKPERFSVKYFEITGLKERIFKELEKIFSSEIIQGSVNLRNSTLLSIVKPLLFFVSNLPQYTLNTEDGLSSEVKAARAVLLKAREPDHLIFQALPKALGLKIIAAEDKNEREIGKSYRKKLVQILKELQIAYDALLLNCEELLYGAFAVRSEHEKLREDLRVRSSYLVGQVMEDQLKRFVYASIDEEDDKASWLETILMIITDKPPRSWTDDDTFLFETALVDLARRFRNLEALQKEKDISGIRGKGFDIRRVTITFPDGNDIPQTIWIDRNQKAKINKIVNKILNEDMLKNNKNLQRAVTTMLLEKIFLSDKLKSQSDSTHLVEEKAIGYKKD